MKYTIKGLTDRTITFNSLGITVRGNSSNHAQYPHSIACGLDIETVEQWNEINAIIKAGFISLEPEENIKLKNKKSSKSDKSSKASVSSKSTKSNKSTKKSKTTKIVRRIVNSDNLNISDVVSDAVIVTPDGLVTKGKMFKTSDMDLQESEITRASIEAAQKIDEEEKQNNNKVFIDESKLDISERMGNDVIVSGTENKSSKTKISRSAVPTVKTNWINLEKDIADNAPHAFIDKDDSKKQEKDDRFIE